jgi:hypothetical protein
MRTPRESFLLTGKVKEFERLISSDAFETACDYALLQLQSEMPPNKFPGMPIDPCLGLDVNAQIHGAIRVIEILKTLHEPVKPPTPTKKETLKYA